MSPVEINASGNDFWRARMDEKYETRQNMNLGHVNKDDAFDNTIALVARMKGFLNREVISEEEFADCLKSNSEKLNLDPEDLKERAEILLEGCKEEE